LPARTRDTVLIDTPVCAATSFIFSFPLIRRLGSRKYEKLGIPFTHAIATCGK
jgi:hypothetical protein